jgi:hypothetical protein
MSISVPLSAPGIVARCGRHSVIRTLPGIVIGLPSEPNEPGPAGYENVCEPMVFTATELVRP